jgi:DDE superfamily endonuclease
VELAAGFAVGTLIPIDWVADDRPFYPGKHKKHGMNLQVITSPSGDILWLSGPPPGSVHDKKAKWIWLRRQPAAAPPQLRAALRTIQQLIDNRLADARLPAAA